MKRQRCLGTWRGPSPDSAFDIWHQCQRDEHGPDIHVCACGAFNDINKEAEAER